MLRLLLAGFLFTIPATASLLAGTPSDSDWTEAEAPLKIREARLHSATTERDYRILLYVPDTPPPPAGFPVLYVLDAHANFHLATHLAHEWRKSGPPIGIHPGIIVGIEHLPTPTDRNPRTDDFTPPAPDLTATGDPSGGRQGGADRFLAFLDDELKPFLRSSLPIDTSRQTLYGHSYGGLFALHVLFTRPDSFRSYVAASPSIWWNRRHILAEFTTWKKSLPPGSPLPHLLISVGDEEQTPQPHHHAAGRADTLIERRQVDNARELAAALTASGLPAQFHLYVDENHGSARVPALNHAVRMAFTD